MNLIKYYFRFTLSYGLLRGIYYNYDKKHICLNDKIGIILATSLINPIFICKSLTYDKKTIELYIQNKKIVNRDWL
jgi:hypothetical protein